MLAASYHTYGVSFSFEEGEHGGDAVLQDTPFKSMIGESELLLGHFSDWLAGNYDEPVLKLVYRLDDGLRGFAVCMVIYMCV